jgi:hypothetical protein
VFFFLLSPVSFDTDSYEKAATRPNPILKQATARRNHEPKNPRERGPKKNPKQRPCNRVTVKPSNVHIYEKGKENRDDKKKRDMTGTFIYHQMRTNK